MSLQMPDLSALEARRALLEQNVAKLRAALQHWHKWSFEYEALKEDISALPPSSSHNDLLQVCHDFEGSVLNQKEIDELLGVDKGLARSASSVSALLRRRLDYVQQNVESVQKQLDATEIELASMDVADVEPVASSLPVTEILEELDEEGNVVSSRLSKPGDETGGMMAALRQAGMKEDDLEVLAGKSNVVTDDQEEELARPKQASADIGDAEVNGVVDGSIRRKSVTFAEDTKPEEPPAARAQPSKSLKPASTTLASPAASPPPTPLKVRDNFDPNNRIIELDEDDREIGSIEPARIPIDESEEDAAMRREMLAYSMNEMGSIVAQLDLEEGDDGSYYTDDEYREDDDVNESATGTDDDENEFGMDTKSMIDEEYRKEMLELESRLNARYFENLGPQAADMMDEGGNLDVQQLAKHTARIAVKEEDDMPKRSPKPTSIPSAPQTPTSALTKEKPSEKAKKGVRFAEELDVAPASSPPTTSQPAAESATPPTTNTTSTPAIKDTVRESSKPASAPTPPTAPSPSSNARKPSRFKAARAAASTPSNSSTSTRPNTSASTSPAASSHLTTPKDSPIAPTVIERAPAFNASTAPKIIPTEPDELDPELIRRQVAEEYYRQRNRRISREGGFKREAFEREEESGDDDEEEVGGVNREGEGEGGVGPKKKMSLFMQARLRRERERGI